MITCDKLIMVCLQAKKYKELRKREEQIEDYLSKHDTLMTEEKEAKTIHEENIVKLLEATSTGFLKSDSCNSDLFVNIVICCANFMIIFFASVPFSCA